MCSCSYDQCKWLLNHALLSVFKAVKISPHFCFYISIEEDMLCTSPNTALPITVQFIFIAKYMYFAFISPHLLYFPCNSCSPIPTTSKVLLETNKNKSAKWFRKIGATDSSQLDAPLRTNSLPNGFQKSVILNRSI